MNLEVDQCVIVEAVSLHLLQFCFQDLRAKCVGEQ